MSMSFTCRTFRTVKIEAGLVNGVVPSCGYLIKWWTIDANGNITSVINEVPTSTQVTELVNIPTCFIVRITVQACCGFDQNGNKRYSLPSSHVELPIATPSPIVISQVSCTNGQGVYRITGTPGQLVQLRAGFQGSFRFGGTGGSCAWIELLVTAQGYSGGSRPIAGTTNTISGDSLEVPDLDFAVTIPPAGLVDINITAMGHNVVSLSSSSATLEVVSVDGAPGSVPVTSLCKGTSSTGGCIP